MSTQGSVPTAARKPANHLVWAILSCLFFLPFAVTSVVYAAKVNGLWAAGDIAGAQRASRRALIFAGSAVAVSVVLIGALLLTGGGTQ